MPAKFMAGTTLTYLRSFVDYQPANGWSLALSLSGPAQLDNVAGVVSGQSWRFTIAPASTQKLVPGLYKWAEVVSSSAGTFLAAHGVVDVVPNVVTASAGELQGYEEKALAIVEAQLLARLTADIESYTVEQRAANKIKITELEAIRGRLLRAIANKRRPGRFLTPVEVNFGRLSELNPVPPGGLW